MGRLNEPSWLRAFVLAAVLAIAAFGAAGLVLADIGQFHPLLWLAAGAIACAGVGQLVRPLARAEGAATEASNVGAIGAVLISAASALWNGLNAAKHVQVDRDGAGYLNAGRWIAEHGTLEVRPYVAPFTRGPLFTAASTGMRPRGAHLEFDVPHMLAALVAEAHDIGGNRLMFLTVPILGGLALLVFYLLAARLLGHPFAALAATATLAVTMPQISFSRDTAAEIPAQVLLFSALWLLCDRRTVQRPGTAFVAGLLLGLLEAVLGDGLVYLLGLPVFFGVLWLRGKRVDRRALLRGMVGLATGIAVGVEVAAYDFARWNRSYWSTETNLGEVLVTAAVVTVVTIAAVTIRRRRPGLAASLRGRREAAAQVGFGAVLVLGIGAWLARPLVQKTHTDANSFVAVVQRLNKLPVDPTRAYSELSVRWISWYLGPITLIFAIVGAAALTRIFVRGALRVPALATALVLAPPALHYLWKPSVMPDHIWAARRLLPAILPGVILLAFSVLCSVARDRSRAWLTERRIAVVVIAVIAVAFPAWTIRDVSQMTEQRELFSVIDDACRKIGRNGAVVMLRESPPRPSIALPGVPQTLRSFCDVPVVSAVGTPQPAKIAALARQWRAKGRRLVMVAQYPRSILEVFPRALVLPTIVGEELHFLAPTLDRRPGGYAPERFRSGPVTQLMIAAVPGEPRRPAPAV